MNKKENVVNFNIWNGEREHPMKVQGAKSVEVVKDENDGSTILVIDGNVRIRASRRTFVDFHIEGSEYIGR